MTNKNLQTLVSIVPVLFLHITAPADARLLPINNPGFEVFVLPQGGFTTHIRIHIGTEILTGDPVPGWVLVGLGGMHSPFPGFM